MPLHTAAAGAADDVFARQGHPIAADHQRRMTGTRSKRSGRPGRIWRSFYPILVTSVAALFLPAGQVEAYHVLNYSSHNTTNTTPFQPYAQVKSLHLSLSQGGWR